MGDLMRISLNETDINDYNSEPAVVRWANSGKRSRRTKVTPYGFRSKPSQIETDDVDESQSDDE